MTSSSADFSRSSPALSPDVVAALLSIPVARVLDVDEAGRLLVADDTSGSMQLYEVDGTRWRQLTALPGPATGRYVTGRRQVVVQHDDGGNERGQLSVLALDASPQPDESCPPLRPLVHDSRWIHRLVGADGRQVRYLTNRRDGVAFDLISRDLVTGAETVLYDGGGYVAEVEPSPDGRWVVLTRPGIPAHSAQLVLIATDDGEVEELTDAHEAAYVHTPSWLPDSSGFVVSTNAGRDYTALVRFDLRFRQWRHVLADDGHDLVGWVAPTGERILVATNDDGGVRLAVHALDDGRHLGDVDLPDEGCAAVAGATEPVWSPDSRFAALTYASPVDPAHVVRVDLSTGAVEHCRRSDAPALPIRPVLPERHRVPTPDGEQVPVFCYRPADGGDGSAVLVVHGGPESQSYRDWSWFTQALVAQGHTVLVPNVRGSTGYGKRWYALDDVRLRLDSVADLAAVHDWLPSQGLDPTRAALYGGSYGGYMVLAGLAFQPGRWAAGVDVVGIASLTTFLERTSDYRRAHREREYGSLERDREFLDEASPLTHVDAIAAPLLVIHGANDPRVPLFEAEQIVAALGARDVPCELLVYADEGHGLAKRANRLDAYPRALAFLARHLSQVGGSRSATA